MNAITYAQFVLIADCSCTACFACKSLHVAYVNGVSYLQFDLDKLVRLQIEYKTPCVCTQLFSKIRRVSEKLQVTSNTFFETKIIVVSVTVFFAAYYNCDLPLPIMHIKMPSVNFLFQGWSIGIRFRIVTNHLRRDSSCSTVYHG